MKNEVKQAAHSSYRCECYIVFAPKYRRKVIYSQLKKDVVGIFGAEDILWIPLAKMRK